MDLGPKPSREKTRNGWSIKLATGRLHGSCPIHARVHRSPSAVATTRRSSGGVPAPAGGHSGHRAQPLHALPLDRGRTVPAPGPTWAPCCRMATHGRRSLGRSAAVHEPLITAGGPAHAHALAEDAIGDG